MTIYVVEYGWSGDGSSVTDVLTSEMIALAVHDADEAAKDEVEFHRVTCWRLQDGRYVKDETWPEVRS